MKLNSIAYLIGLLLITTVGCRDTKEADAQRIYDAAMKYSETHDYPNAIELLQRVTVDYNDTETAARAEREIQSLENLYQLLIDNQRARVSQKFTRIALALDQYRLRYLSYPITTKDLEKLPPDHVPDLVDEWGNPFYYKAYPSDGVPEYEPDNYALASFGQDGLPGGGGLDQDRFYQNGKEVGQLMLP